MEYVAEAEVFELGIYPMRRERVAFRPLGNRAGMGALVLLSGPIPAHRLTIHWAAIARMPS
jgi:hypothetical protein